MLGRLKRDATSTFSAGDWLPIIHRASDREGSIALTFDDGPTPETTPRVLDLLAGHGARATFFLCGKRVEAHPALVAAIVDAGHDVYAHGYSHLRLDGLPEDEAIAELERTEALLARHRPTPGPYLVRLPYGAGHRDARVHRLLRRWRGDCQIAHWRYDLKDFRLAAGCAGMTELGANCDAALAKALADRRFAGSVVLMHENPFEAEGDLVPEIAAALLSRLLNETTTRGIAVRGADPVRRQSWATRFIRTVPIE